MLFCCLYSELLGIIDNLQCFLGAQYSITLFDTDLNEEVWVEDAAHHGPIYEIKWSRDDRYMLSCSGGGTCKVWDMLAVSFRANNVMSFGALNAANGNNTPGGGSNSHHHPNQHYSAAARAILGEVQQPLTALQSASAKPPFLVHTLVASPPVFTYCAVFQDQARSSFTNTNSTTTLGAAASAAAAAVGDAAEDGSAYAIASRNLDATSTVPRIITGAADGKLRVWDGSQLKGYIVIAHKDGDKGEEGGGGGDKDKNNKHEGSVVDYSPHDGHVNSLVIDERSR
jgi:WD40 repeat protein